MSEPRPIQDEVEYEAAIQRIEALWEAPEGSPEHDELTKLVDAVHEYENADPDLVIVD